MMMWALTAFPGIVLSIPIFIFALVNAFLRKPLCKPGRTALITLILVIVDYHAFQIMFFSQSMVHWTIPKDEERLSNVVYIRLGIEIVSSLLLYYGANLLHRWLRKRSDNTP